MLTDRGPYLEVLTEIARALGEQGENFDRFVAIFLETYLTQARRYDWAYVEALVHTAGFYDQDKDVIIFDRETYRRSATAINRRSWGEVKKTMLGVERNRPNPRRRR